MNKTIHGIVHGKTIELDEELGVADGQEVEVSVKIVQAKGKWGEGILRSAGGWSGILKWTLSWRRFMKIENWNADRRWMNSELPTIVTSSLAGPVF